MQNLTIILTAVAVSLTVSAVCWFAVGSVLRRVTAFLCDDGREGVKETGGLFWQRIYGSLSVFVPLLFVLLFAPNFERGLADNLLYALRWSVFGGVSLLLALAYQVSRQIRFNSRAKQPPSVAPAAYRLQQLAEQKNPPETPQKAV